jgi:PAS domain S-box-containing protein
MSEISAGLFQQFTDAMPQGACLVDPQGTIVYWNAAAEAITGYHRHDVLGRPYRGDLLVQISADASAAAKSPVHEVLRNGAPVSADLFLRHKNGYRLPLKVTAFPLRDSENHLSGVGELFELSQPRQGSVGWVGHPDREFEMATGLPAVAESREQLAHLARSSAARSAAILLVEMTEQEAILKHGGPLMLHQALRVLARTVASLLPSRNYVGCWDDWRLLAIVPECDAVRLSHLESTLAQVGSSCAVKWWGDRVTIRSCVAARLVAEGDEVESIPSRLERQLQQVAGRKG